MTKISDLRPTTAARVIDLVAAAGVDVSDWSDFKGGEKKAASNPKYCYDWAFVEPDKVVVLNLWYDSLDSRDGQIFQHLNYQKHAQDLPKAAARGTWAKRSYAMDAAFALAARKRLPVRVVICDGKKGDVIRDPANSSKVSQRMLDSVPWAITEYDALSGDCVITRGVEPLVYEDQFSMSDTQGPAAPRRNVTGEVFDRDQAVRSRVLKRARGYCEYCNCLGFEKLSGAVYLETHHIVSLSEDGPDNDSNVIALCPNHHREAHYGVEALRLRARFLDIVQAKIALTKS